MSVGAFLASEGAAFGDAVLRTVRWLARLLRAAPEPRQVLADDLQLYRVVTENVSDVIVRLDRARRRTYVSPSCQEVLGYTRAEMLGGGAFDLVHPDDLDNVLALFAQFGPENPISEATWRIKCKDRRYIWVEARYRYLDWDGGLVVILRDVNRRKIAEDRLADAMRRLEYLAMQDSLTGLPNRLSLLETLAKKLTAGEATAVLFIDLDGFKPINDVYGHDIGDAVLITVAKRLAGAIGRNAVVGRLGGDEFSVLLDASGGDADVAVGATNIIDAISAPIVVGATTVKVAASVGIAVSPRDGTEVSTILRAADAAMYNAKRVPGGHFEFFFPWMELKLGATTHYQRATRGYHDTEIEPAERAPGAAPEEAALPMETCHPSDSPQSIREAVLDLASHGSSQTHRE